MKKFILMCMLSLFPLKYCVAGSDEKLFTETINISADAVSYLKSLNYPEAYKSISDTVLSDLKADHKLNISIYVVSDKFENTAAKGTGIDVLTLVDMLMGNDVDVTDNVNFKRIFQNLILAAFSDVSEKAENTKSGYKIKQADSANYEARKKQIINGVLIKRYSSSLEKDIEQDKKSDFQASKKNMAGLIDSWFASQQPAPAPEVGVVTDKPLSDMNQSVDADTGHALPEALLGAIANNIADGLRTTPPYADYMNALRGNINLTYTPENLDADLLPDYNSGPIGNAIQLMTLFDLAGYEADSVENKNAVIQLLKDVVFKGVNPNNVGEMHTRAEGLLIGVLKAKYGATAPGYGELKASIWRIHGQILSWLGIEKLPANGWFLTFVYQKVFGDLGGVDVKAAFERASFPTSISNTPRETVMLTDEERAYLGRAAEMMPSDSFYASYFAATGQPLTFVPAGGDYAKGSSGNVLDVMALLDVGIEKLPDELATTVNSIQAKIAKVVFENNILLEEGGNTLSGKTLRNVGMAERQIFFQPQENLLIGTLQKRLSNARELISYAEFKEVATRIHKRILGWFGITKTGYNEGVQMTTAFLEHIYIASYGKGDIDIKAAFNALTQKTAQESVPMKIDPPAQMEETEPMTTEIDLSKINLGTATVNQQDNSIYLLKALEGKKAVAKTKDGFTDAYLTQALSKMIQQKSYGPGTNLLGVIKQVEEEYAKQYAQDKTEYAYQWLIFPTSINDPEKAAQTCVSTIEASPYGEKFDMDWDYYSAVMVTQTSKVGVRENKKHLCGMIFSRIVE